MAFDKTHACWMFPTPLWGSRESTDSKWKRIVARAYETGNWDIALGDASRESVWKESAEISISEGYWSYPVSKKMWRAYFPHHVLNRRLPDMFDKLFFAGLSELWFAVGLLSSQATRASRFGSEWDATDEARDSWWLPLFRGLVSWLPELEMLAPRIASTMDPELARSFHPQLFESEVGNMQWVDSICRMSKYLGDGFSIEDLAKTYQGDLVAALLDRNWIRRDGDRYVSLL